MIHSFNNTIHLKDISHEYYEFLTTILGIESLIDNTG